MRGSRQRRYSEEQIATALVALDANAGNLRRTARHLGIPHTTLLEWRNERETGQNQAGVNVTLDAQVVELRTRTRNDMALALEGIIWKCLTRLSESALLDESTKPTELSKVMSDGIDKMRLVRGESTQITEQKLENRRWAEDKLQELMRSMQIMREQAMEILKDEAPVLYSMLIS